MGVFGRLVSQGLKAVRESDEATTADEGVQRLIRRRIEGYPDKAQADMHHARSVRKILRHLRALGFVVPRGESCLFHCCCSEIYISR